MNIEIMSREIGMDLFYQGFQQSDILTNFSRLHRLVEEELGE